MRDRLKFLIVEDELVSGLLLREMLQPFGDCQMVGNGNEAMEILRRSCERPRERFDLVCLDIVMPGKNGHEVLRELRHLEMEKGYCGPELTKVFMVSSLDDSRNIVEALVVGRCEAYLAKPVSRQRLEEHLRAVRLIEPVC